MAKVIEGILLVAVLAGASLAQEKNGSLAAPTNCVSLFRRFEQVQLRHEYYEGGPVRLGDSWIHVKQKLGEPDLIKSEPVDTYVYRRPGCAVEIYFHNGRTHSKSFRLLPERAAPNSVPGSRLPTLQSPSDHIPCVCLEGNVVELRTVRQVVE